MDRREFGLIVGAFLLAGAMAGMGTLYLVRNYVMGHPDDVLAKMQQVRMK